MIVQTLDQWQINAHYPYAPLLFTSAETGRELKGILQPVSAAVPGCIYDDLLRAGVIEDPYFEMNSLKCSWVADFWWKYDTTFSVEKFQPGLRYRLCLEGIDYEAIIFLNGKKIGEHQGMFTPFICDITEYLNGEGLNRVTVLLKDAPKELGQYGYTEDVKTQKARFSYKWDFGTRLVHLGLYKRAYVECLACAAIEDIRVFADSSGRVTACCTADIFQAGQKSICWKVLKNGEIITEVLQKPDLSAGRHELEIQMLVSDPLQWYCAGEGAQELYTLMVSIGGDHRSIQFGFRELQYCQAEGAPSDSLPYSILLNGRQIYIKGVNMVPLDLMYGRVTIAQAEHMIKLMRDAGINLVRVWGGGLIESEEFYDLCDRYGILVWQDFIQSGSGLGNLPGSQPDFLKICRKTAEYAVRYRQHHPSLAFWCGGNELTAVYDKPCDITNPNLKMLSEIVQKYDGKTFFLPTTASGPREFLNVDAPGSNYDVHGPWQYNGEVEHYTVFNHSDSILHSEFGTPGMTNLSALKTVLSPERWKVSCGEEDIIWRYHAEWWDTLERDSHLFGPFAEDELEAFIACSQFVQADALRYALEANRRRAFANVGSMVWQMNEPWPQLSGTNLVDYYGKPKAAYYAVKLAYRRAYPNLRYDKLLFAPGEEAKLEIFMTSEEETADWKITLHIWAESGQLLEQTFEIQAGGGRSVQAGKAILQMPDAGTVYVFLAASNGERHSINLYPLFVRGKNGADRDAAVRFRDIYQELCDDDENSDFLIAHVMNNA